MPKCQRCARLEIVNDAAKVLLENIIDAEQHLDSRGHILPDVDTLIHAIKFAKGAKHHAT